MPRLFWKFFAIVWLTMSLTTMLALFFMHVNEPRNPGAEALDNIRRLTVALLAERLQHQPQSDAEDFIRKSLPEVPEIALEIKPNTPTATCSSGFDLDSFDIAFNGQCYHLVLQQTPHWPWFKQWPLMFPWLTAIVASLFSAYALGKYLITPVAHLRSGLRALAEGHFDIRIHGDVKNRKDEIAQLTKDFDTSAARLQELHEGRQRLFHDISHELRSPLSRLQAVIGILRKNPGRLPSLLDRMEREIERLDRLVGEVLTLARLSSAGQNNDEAQVVDILDLVDNIVQDAAFEASEKGVTLAFKRDGKFIATVNGELIYRAIENVIRNAVKYTAMDTTVGVETDLSGEQLRILVKDKGPGVPEADLESIFRPFTSLGASGTASGYGLGLAITKTALQRHGGDVSAINAPDGGLIVTILIPPTMERG
ncbi:ATP-binding protein [Rhizobium sp.]|jgi:two-component system, OmpR family, sensor kinase|uniref:HAMP domain-containing sensor histidine kinase n=1 Tax=Rhizobium sp. TaxID=391 RepID=UPI002AA7E204